MAKQRILFFSQEIAPYLPATENSRLGKNLPVAMQGKKYEVRTFMPNFGAVNERRNQLHEVIRLSGVNIVIGDADHPLIIKVASMQPSRIQVYFIDNDDYFQKDDSDTDDVGSNRPDNDERAIFYAHGAVGTAEKLRWEPDLIHVSGWISSLIPLYIRRVFNVGPDFKKAKIIYTVLREPQTAPIDSKIFEKLAENGVKEEDIERLKSFPFDSNILHRIAIEFADGVVFNTTEPDPALLEAVKERGIPFITLDPEAENTENFFNFFQTVKGE
ncbi:MAG: glycogen/starch synthase [Muribaculaceae bacterium]|nr:glycogen/starch synthase [Muribaculaceae bacterium]